MAKVDKQLDKIIEELIELRTKKGYSTGSLVKYLKKKYTLEQSRSYDLIKMARERIGEFAYVTNEKVLEDAVERLESLYEMAIKDGNGKLALNVQQEIDKVLQLHTTKLEIDGNLNIEQALFGPLNKDND